MRAPFLAVVVLLAAACNGTPNTGPAQQNTTGGSTGGSSGSGPAYTLTQVTGCGDHAGTQTVMASKGSGVAFVTIATKDGSTTDCTPEARPTQQVQNYALCYGEASGTTVTASEIAAVPMIAFNGVGLAVSPSGAVSVAYTGGPNAPARCGGSDLKVISKTTSSFGGETTLADLSASAGQYCVPPPPAAQPTGPNFYSEMTACGTSPECVQDVCGQGAATGFWPAITYDSSNTLMAAFRDLHFGFGESATAKSDVELKKGSGGVQTIDVAQGGGEYMRIGTTADGKLTIVHYNGEGPTAVNGIWVHRETSAGITRQRISDRPIGELLGFAISSTGVHGVAFYDSQLRRLVYLESVDGEVWNEPEDVDTNGNIGQHPSLTFDAAGEPVIAYYRCAAQNSTTDCDQAKDGLYLARRIQGSWSKRAIVEDTSSFEGTYPAVALVGGKVWVAYQKRTFDPSAPAGQQTAQQLFLAKEP